MSSPFGHSLAGFIIYSYKNKSLKPKETYKLFFYIFIANAPDLDFLIGMMVGKPNLYHHGISHSLGMAALFAFIIALFAHWFQKNNDLSIKNNFFLLFILICSHLFFDLISVDGRPPYGIPLFWPFSDRYFMVPILPPVKHSVLDHATIIQFFEDVFSVHNIYVVLLEIIVMTPFVLIMMLLNKFWHKQNDS